MMEKSAEEETYVAANKTSDNFGHKRPSKDSRNVLSFNNVTREKQFTFAPPPLHKSTLISPNRAGAVGARQFSNSRLNLEQRKKTLPEP
jgi:hypothetical protein